jgi:hypothetical protein
MVLKSGSLNLLEPSGPVKDCNGIAGSQRTDFKHYLDVVIITMTLSAA